MDAHKEGYKAKDAPFKIWIALSLTEPFSKGSISLERAYEY